MYVFEEKSLKEGMINLVEKKFEGLLYRNMCFSLSHNLSYEIWICPYSTSISIFKNKVDTALLPMQSSKKKTIAIIFQCIKKVFGLGSTKLNFHA